MRQAILLDRILERARDMRLPDQIVERLRTIFSGEDLIAHVPNLVRPIVCENTNPRNGGLKSPI
jgi:urease gamma subunit